MVLVASCGTRTGGQLSPAPAPRSVAFAEVTTTAQSGHDGAVMIVVGTTDAARATIARLVPNAAPSAGRVLVAAFQGQQSTGGYSIHIAAIERRADQLVVRAIFTSPLRGGFVTQVLTSPAHVVSIDAADASGAREVILVDDAGVEHARTGTT